MASEEQEALELLKKAKASEEKEKKEKKEKKELEVSEIESPFAPTQTDADFIPVRDMPTPTFQASRTQAPQAIPTSQTDLESRSREAREGRGREERLEGEKTAEDRKYDLASYEAEGEGRIEGLNMNDLRRSGMVVDRTHATHAHAITDRQKVEMPRMQGMRPDTMRRDADLVKYVEAEAAQAAFNPWAREDALGLNKREDIRKYRGRKFF